MTGLETDGTIGNLGFVDTYGTAFGRDMEPTVESGDYLYQVRRHWPAIAAAVHGAVSPACRRHRPSLIIHRRALHLLHGCDRCTFSMSGP